MTLEALFRKKERLKIDMEDALAELEIARERARRIEKEYISAKEKWENEAASLI